MLQRMVTLATQSANATMNSTAWSNVQTEYNALVEEIDRITNYTDFNGTKPLGNNDNPGQMTFQIGPSGAEVITVKGKDLSTNGTMSDLKAKDAIQSREKANGMINKINQAINDVSTYRAELGAAQNRLEHTYNSLKVTSENIQDAESRIRDTNMPDEITSFTKNNILLQASQSMLSQANAVPQSVLSMLG
jgi:flagellin